MPTPGLIYRCQRPRRLTFEPPSAEQLTKKLTNTLERFAKMMTPEFRREFRKLPAEVKERFMSAVQELRDHVAELK